MYWFAFTSGMSDEQETTFVRDAQTVVFACQNALAASTADPLPEVVAFAARNALGRVMRDEGSFASLRETAAFVSTYMAVKEPRADDRVGVGVQIGSGPLERVMVEGLIACLKTDIESYGAEPGQLCVGVCV
jgi:hypothetical protein